MVDLRLKQTKLVVAALFHVPLRVAFEISPPLHTRINPSHAVSCSSIKSLRTHFQDIFCSLAECGEDDEPRTIARQEEVIRQHLCPT